MSSLPYKARFMLDALFSKTTPYIVLEMLKSKSKEMSNRVKALVTSEGREYNASGQGHREWPAGFFV